MNDKNTLVEKLVSYLDNYPEEWFQPETNSIRHKSKITITKHRLGGVSITLLNEYSLRLTAPERGIMKSAMRRWNEWAIAKHEKDSIDAILKALYDDVKSGTATSVAKKKINGDI